MILNPNNLRNLIQLISREVTAEDNTSNPKMALSFTRLLFDFEQNHFNTFNKLHIRDYFFKILKALKAKLEQSGSINEV